MPRTEGNFLFHKIKIGERGRKIMQASEVCMRMKVTDKYMDFEVIVGGSGYPMVQLYYLPEQDTDQRFKRMFSAPITAGEAGLSDWHDADGLRYYPHELADHGGRELDPIADAEPFPKDTQHGNSHKG